MTQSKITGWIRPKPVRGVQCSESGSVTCGPHLSKKLVTTSKSKGNLIKEIICTTKKYMDTWGQFRTHFDLWEPFMTLIFVLGFSYIPLGGVYISEEFTMPKADKIDYKIKC